VQPQKIIDEVRKELLREQDDELLEYLDQRQSYYLAYTRSRLSELGALSAPLSEEEVVRAKLYATLAELSE
jgi:hypothetical protein